MGAASGFAFTTVDTLTVDSLSLTHSSFHGEATELKDPNLMVLVDANTS